MHWWNLVCLIFGLVGGVFISLIILFLIFIREEVPSLIGVSFFAMIGLISIGLLPMVSKNFQQYNRQLFLTSLVMVVLLIGLMLLHHLTKPGEQRVVDGSTNHHDHHKIHFAPGKGSGPK